MTIVQSTVEKSTPQHIAIIMDGNRRWAKQFGLPAAVGHANGARRVRNIALSEADLGPTSSFLSFLTDCPC